MQASTLVEGNKIHFISLGCSRNLVDSEVMLGILLQSGYEVTEDFKTADYLIVNTCGFLAASRQESLDTIGEVFKEKKTSAKVIVAGCMVQKHSSEIKDKFPTIHSLVGTGAIEKILEAVQTPSQGEYIASAKSYLQMGEIPRKTSTPKHYAYLKIAEGCAKRCSFCIIPNIKGALQSKPIPQVVKEFKSLLDQGVKEIIFIAQDLGDYGKDRKEIGGLENLMEAVLEEKRDFWLRLLYLYPDEITDRMIDIMQNDKRVCRYLDMPIQHINNRILKTMRRKTTGDDIKATIRKLREKMPDIVIRTSLMVGFPGETEEEFEELVDFIQKYPLDNVGIFTYSKEEESHSATLEGHLPDDVKQRRFEKLAAVQKKTVAKLNKKYIGKKFTAFVEGFHPESEFLMTGRFYGQCPDIDGQIVINDGRKVDGFGKLYEVEITDIFEYDLIGRVIRPIKPAPAKLAMYG